MDKLKSTQVGGTHYQGYDYQPIELIEDLKLNFTEGCILKYVIRFRDKGGKEDLLKALDYVKRELIKLLERKPEKKEIDRKAIGFIVTFVSQDRINSEDRDFILDVAKYLHAGLMTKVCDTILKKVESTYLDENDKFKEEGPSDPKTQLKQVHEAVKYVLGEVDKRENETKDKGVLEQMQANAESYRDMKLILEIFKDNIEL
jgi:hypothetical protein